MTHSYSERITVQTEGGGVFVSVDSIQQTHPVLGEERLSDTWYIPLVLPEMLEFLCETKPKKQKPNENRQIICFSVSIYMNTVQQGRIKRFILSFVVLLGHNKKKSWKTTSSFDYFNSLMMQNDFMKTYNEIKAIESCKMLFMSSSI